MKLKALALVASAMVAVPALASGELSRPASVGEQISRSPGLMANLPANESGAFARIQSGTRNGLTYLAQRTIIGQTPTSDTRAAGPMLPINSIGGGDPIYKPSAGKSGVVALIMQNAAGGLSICSGSVIGGGMSIATAGHCVSDGFGTANPVRTTAYFFKGDPDERTPFQSGGVAIDVSRYIVNPGYTGEVIDQNDIAILRLERAAPKFAQVYDIYNSNISGLDFNVAGYGTRSTVGGQAGNTPPAGARTGWLREGDNKFDYAWGNDLFQDFFTARDVGGPFAGQNFFGFAEVEYSFISDFDNGLRDQDAARQIANALGLGPIGNDNFDNTGRGAREVGIAGGDSGGPGFIDGKLASINSYGLIFAAGGFGDLNGGLNSGFGEFSGYVPTFIHTDFINAAIAVPEPGSWAMLIAGFGLTGAAMRRQRRAPAGAAA